MTRISRSGRGAKIYCRVCSSRDLEEGGVGIRFEVTRRGVNWPAFVVRHTRGLSAFINRCSHLDLELDWDPGWLFDREGRYLICSTHGASYEPETGACVDGPCGGIPLESLRVIEADDGIYLDDPHYFLTVISSLQMKD